MRIGWAEFCTSVEQTPTGVTMHNVGACSGISPEFPVYVAVQIALNIVATYHELGTGATAELRCNVRTPDTMEPVDGFPITKMLTLGRAVNTERFPAGAEARRIRPLTLEWVAATPGDYTIELALTDGDPSTLVFYVLPADS